MGRRRGDRSFDFLSGEFVSGDFVAAAFLDAHTRPRIEKTRCVQMQVAVARVNRGDFSALDESLAEPLAESLAAERTGLDWRLLAPRSNGAGHWKFLGRSPELEMQLVQKALPSTLVTSALLHR